MNRRRPTGCRANAAVSQEAGRNHTVERSRPGTAAVATDRRTPVARRRGIDVRRHHPEAADRGSSAESRPDLDATPVVEHPSQLKRER